MFLLLTFQWVQDDYTSRGWTKHDARRLEYQETNSENPKPFITFEVAEPADDMEKNWKIMIIGGVSVSYTFSLFFLLELLDFQLFSLCHVFMSLYVIQFEKSVVDQLTEEHHIHVTHFGMEWMGSPNDICCSTVRKIKLLEMRGPCNDFNIFLPKEALAVKKNRESMHAHCTHAYKLIFCAMTSL